MLPLGSKSAARAEPTVLLAPVQLPPGSVQLHTAVTVEPADGLPSGQQMKPVPYT